MLKKLKPEMELLLKSADPNFKNIKKCLVKFGKGPRLFFTLFVLLDVLNLYFSIRWIDRRSGWCEWSFRCRRRIPRLERYPGPFPRQGIGYPPRKIVGEHQSLNLQGTDCKVFISADDWMGYSCPPSISVIL